MLNAIYIMFMLMFVVFMVIQTHIIFRELKEKKHNNPVLRYGMYTLVTLIWVLYITTIIYVTI